MYQHGFFVAWLTAPAYLAVEGALKSLGVVLAWYHRAGLLALCLLSAVVVMVTPGLLLILADRVVRSVRHRSELRK